MQAGGLAAGLFLFPLFACSRGGADPKDVKLAAIQFPEDLDELEGMLKPKEKPLVVNHWSITCIPCVDELPYISSTAKKYEGKIDFIGVAWDKLSYDFPDATIRARVDKVRAATGAGFPTIVPPPGISAMAKRLKLRSEAVPQTYVFKATGELLWGFVGELGSDEERAEFEEAIEKAIGG